MASTVERISVVSPAFNEQENLPLLLQQLREVLDDMEVEWEWIVVDDHSSDRTFAVLTELAEEDARVRGIRLSRNHGSHAAIGCALHHTTGDCVVVLAADLQDPPETIPALVDKWRSGAHLVWAVRSKRQGERFTRILTARLYHAMMNRIVGLTEMPPTGADFVLLDRRVVETYRQFHETHVSLFALLTWMGFRHESLPYDKQARRHGRSGWTLRKKLKLATDSVLAFSLFPLRLMSWLGALVAVGGVAYGLYLAYLALQQSHPPGWSLVLVAILILGGLQLIMLGIIGQYLWRTMDEARRRPRYLVEDRVGFGERAGDGAAGR